MSQATRKHRRLRPYAWLGAGAVTLGLGASMVGGAAVAFADTADAPSSDTATSAPASGASSETKTGPATGRRAAATHASAATATRKARTATQAPAPVAATAETPVAITTVTPAASAPTATSRPSRRGVAATAPRAAVTVATLPSLKATKTPSAAADPSPSTDSWIPDNIVPGEHVTMALSDIAAAQSSLNAATWGTGNVLSGLASIVPQLFLAEASLSLTLWQNNMSGAQQLVAATTGIPIIHQLTEINLFATTTLPTFTQLGLGGAALFLPLVNLFGASTAATSASISSARSNGQVYAVVPVLMKATTEPTIGVRVNNAASVPVLVDSGSSGLLVTSDSVGTLDPANIAGTGEISFSGDTSKTFHYTTYKNTPVDFGGGAVTQSGLVDVIDDADSASFKAFLAPAGVVGIFGTGANAAGPGPNPIPNSVLPGELSDGYLLNQNVFLGLFGVMIFGPNPFANRVVVPGSPDAWVQVKINNGTAQTASAIIDSGGVYGTLPAYLINGGAVVPSGTVISVYDLNGEFLYSYTVNNANAPTVVPDTEAMNTGYVPFQQQPIYIDYSYPGGIGSTNFVYS